jgi:cell division protein FtsB
VTARLHRATDRSRPRLTPRAAILTVIVTALLLYLVVPVRGYMEQRDHLIRLEQQADSLRRENQLLESRIQLLNDPAYIERIARECHGMVRPGEISLILAPAEGRPVSLPACGPSAP